MEIWMDSEEEVMSRNRKGKHKGKRQQPKGAKVPTPEQAAQQAHEDLCRHEKVWRERLEADPSLLAEVEREVHAQMRFHADVFVAGLLSQASSSAAMNEHVGRTMEEAEGELRAIEKKDVR